VGGYSGPRANGHESVRISEQHSFVNVNREYNERHKDLERSTRGDKKGGYNIIRSTKEKIPPNHRPRYVERREGWESISMP